jgi:hypothetical protein
MTSIYDIASERFPRTPLSHIIQSYWSTWRDRSYKKNNTIVNYMLMLNEGDEETAKRQLLLLWDWRRENDILHGASICQEIYSYLRGDFPDRPSPELIQFHEWFSDHNFSVLHIDLDVEHNGVSGNANLILEENGETILVDLKVCPTIQKRSHGTNEHGEPVSNFNRYCYQLSLLANILRANNIEVTKAVILQLHSSLPNVREFFVTPLHSTHT